MYGIYFELMKIIRKITTRKWLDLETLGYGPIMPKNLLDIGWTNPKIGGSVDGKQL